MLIKQLSIFLENRKGRFTEVAKILGIERATLYRKLKEDVKE